VSFSDEGLTFCFSGFCDKNFTFKMDARGRPSLFMMHFEEATFLPISFLAYAVANHMQSFPPSRKRLSRSLPYYNIAVMKEIFYWLQISWWGVGLTKEQVKAIKHGQPYCEP
jgi:hypothetical protein